MATQPKIVKASEGVGLDPWRTIQGVQWAGLRTLLIGVAVNPVDNIMTSFNGSLSMNGDVLVTQTEFNGGGSSFSFAAPGSASKFFRDHFAPEEVPETVTFAVNAAWTFQNVGADGAAVSINAVTEKQLNNESDEIIDSYDVTRIDSTFALSESFSLNTKTLMFG